MREAVIVSTARSPIGRASKGSLKEARPDDLATVNGPLSLAWRPGALRVNDADADRLLATYVATIADGLRIRPTQRRP